MSQERKHEIGTLRRIYKGKRHANHLYQQIIIGTEMFFTSASCQDLQDRQHYQINRYLQLMVHNALTPEWQAYGERHADRIAQFSLSRPIDKNGRSR